MNTFGKLFRLTTFGESHGKAIGGIIDGCPAGLHLDMEAIASEMRRRRPGSSPLASQRKEDDIPEFLSGISPEGVTLGTPIGFIIPNSDHHSRDYDDMRHLYRPNHADFAYDAKYGIRDWRGGGRASARETANWVAAGAVARQLCQRLADIRIEARLLKVGGVTVDDSGAWEKRIEDARNSGDSIGGLVECTITGLPAGLGEPTADRLDSRLAAAMMGINAAKGVEIGAGFSAADDCGSHHADIFTVEEGFSAEEGQVEEGQVENGQVGTVGKVTTLSNNSGGIQGGISNGMPVTFRVAFKPTPTIFKELPTVSDTMKPATLKARGRHDPCVAVRAVPVVEAMAALTIADFLLLARCSRI